MMNLRKKTLALAMATAILGGGMSAAHAQFVNPNGLGQALIYPYYTTNAGWNTLIHVINTSEFTVAAKVRFRSATDSTDLYDIVLVLSPHDMWTASVELGFDSGGSLVNGVRATDNSCTAPHYGKNVFQPFATQANSSEGYAEVIMMGISQATATGTVAANARHNLTTGVPANCLAVDQAFAVTGAAFAPVGAEFNNALVGVWPLTGKYNLTNVGNAWAGAARAVAIANFNPVGSPYTTSQTGMWSQGFGDFDHPTLAEGLNGLAAVNTALTHTSVINEWNLNPGLGERSSWVLTFPTKRLTVEAINAINADPAQTDPVANNFAGCQTPTGSLLTNREELVTSIPSGTALNLCNEVNVITFRNSSTDSAGVLRSAVGVSLDTNRISSGIAAGWLQLSMPTNSISTTSPLPQTSLINFPTGPTTGGITFPTLPYTLAGGVGRPVIGFNITARDDPQDTVLYDHAYQ